MASLHRIQWIDEQIRLRMFPGIPQIVERFEISRRQALRDIEYMRDSLGAPIEYSPKAKGYYYSDESFAVPGQLITENQRELLSCLAAHYEGLSRHDDRSADAYTMLAELLLRLSGTQSSPATLQHFPGDGVKPFRAVLRLETSRPLHLRVPTTLQPYYRGKNELHQDIFEFYNSYSFIPALLASGLPYQVVHPKWLRNKLIQHLDRMRQANLG